MRRTHTAFAAIRLFGLLGGICLLAAGCRGPVESPAPPGGDESFQLDPQTFEDSVLPVLTARGCSNVLCHGGGPRGSFELSPPDAPNPGFDFEQVSLQVHGWEPEASPILLKPLSQDAGGVDHAGEGLADGFDSTSEPDYILIRDWILAGEYR